MLEKILDNYDKLQKQNCRIICKLNGIDFFMLEKCMVVTILNYFTMLSPRGKEMPYKKPKVKIFLFLYFT